MADCGCGQNSSSEKKKMEIVSDIGESNKENGQDESTLASLPWTLILLISGMLFTIITNKEFRP